MLLIDRVVDLWQCEHITISMVGSIVVRDVMVVTRVKILQSDPKGKPPFEMCWLCMGIAQIALDPPPLSNRQTWN